MLVWKLQIGPYYVWIAGFGYSGIGYATAGSGDYPPAMFTSVYGGQEREEADGGGQLLVGVVAAVQPQRHLLEVVG